MNQAVDTEMTDTDSAQDPGEMDVDQELEDMATAATELMDGRALSLEEIGLKALSLAANDQTSVDD